ncbi:MAG: hypothetical protein IPN20_14920 [Haliscomenobacter sp.]|jgi:quercetin dioxygenase-like cupin family protein|nr:hypothetical protein [Haliscomenobacter sp.]MBV6426216.1 hypothetical protein [Haliscomenobacter sp.]
MNLRELHDVQSDVHAKSLFKTSEGNVTAMQIMEGALLKEHVTKVQALLVCITGEVVFENENGLSQTLGPGDFIRIEPFVVHWAKGILESQLLLIK